MKSASLSRSFSLVLCIALLATLIVTALAWRFSVDQQIEALREDRFRFSLGNVRAALESALQLGFLETDLPGAQSLIEQVLARQADILSIEVFDTQGRILYTTDRAGLGAVVPPAVREVCLDRKAGFRAVDDEDARRQCVVLVNSYEQAVGAVMIRYRRLEGLEVEAWSGGWQAFLIEWALFGGLGALLGWLAVRPIERRLDCIRAQVEGRIPTGINDADPAINRELAVLQGPDACQGLAALDAIDRELDQIEGEADRIDQLEEH